MLFESETAVECRKVGSYFKQGGKAIKFFEKEEDAWKALFNRFTTFSRLPLT